jgi:hypothetical protein
MMGAMDAEARNAIDQLAGMIAREFERIHAEFAKVYAEFADVHGELAEVNQRLDRHERRLDRIDVQLIDFRREVKSEFAALTSRVDSLELNTSSD